MSEPRPTKLTPELALAAATDIVKRLLEGKHLDPERAKGAAQDIARIGKGCRYIDGYDLARALDEDYGWECNFRMAEILDGFAGAARDKIGDAERSWAERTKPQPPYPVGAHIRLPSGETGKITEIDKYWPAKYCVKIDGDKEAKPPSNARRIVDFENALAMESTS